MINYCVLVKLEGIAASTIPPIKHKFSGFMLVVDRKSNESGVSVSPTFCPSVFVSMASLSLVKFNKKKNKREIEDLIWLKNLKLTLRNDTKHEVINVIRQSCKYESKIKINYRTIQPHLSVSLRYLMETLSQKLLVQTWLHIPRQHRKVIFK